MITIRPPDIEAEVTFLPTNQGGKTRPVISGYRPQHQIMEDMQTSGEHYYLTKENVAPGESSLAHIWFISPDKYPETIWIGREIEVKEGSKVVGIAKVIKIFNTQLVSKEKKVKKWGRSV